MASEVDIFVVCSSGIDEHDIVDGQVGLRGEESSVDRQPLLAKYRDQMIHESFSNVIRKEQR